MKKETKVTIFDFLLEIFLAISFFLLAVFKSDFVVENILSNKLQLLLL